MKRTTLPRWGFTIVFLTSLPFVAIAEESPTAPSSLAKEVKEQKPQAGQVIALLDVVTWALEFLLT